MNFPYQTGKRFSQSGSLHYTMPLLFIVIFAVLGVGLLVYSHAATPQCPADSGSSEGQRVAMEAQRQWCIWNGGKNKYGNVVSHSQQLDWITDGHRGEAWCADFVSYIYLNAGYPFKARGGYYSRSGWDWPNANSLEHLPGFTYHPTGSGYRPRAGDIAEFNYPGGHVEIVTDTSPLTFIYGDTSSSGMGKDNYTSGHVLGYITPN